MPCCGRAKRNTRKSETTPPSRRGKRVPPLANKYISFQYCGKTALTVYGKISGKKYRFHAPGTILPIDQRDYTSIRLVPMLKQLGPSRWK
jgi:hypothetical protein